MEKQETLFNEAKLASILREELFKTSQNTYQQEEIQDLSNFELISKNEEKVVKEEKPYVSPIFSMSEDEILNFVEAFDVNELATLSVEEINHISEVLGVDPMVLSEGI